MTNLAAHFSLIEENYSQVEKVMTKKGSTMKRNSTTYSMIVLLIGLIALTAARTYAQTNSTKQIELLSYSFGLSQGASTKIKIFVCPSAPGRQVTPVSARIQILDTEGEVIAQSDEIKVAPGKIRFWDVPRNLAAGGRIEVAARILVTPQTDNIDPELILPTIESIDDFTNNTVHVEGKRFIIFVPTPIRTEGR